MLIIRLVYLWITNYLLNDSKLFIIYWFSHIFSRDTGIHKLFVNQTPKLTPKWFKLIINISIILQHIHLKYTSYI